jgi:hypothetical protein
LHVYKYGSNYVESQFYEKPISLIKEHQKSHLNEMALSVVMDGIEPPTQGFSVLCSTD